MARQMNSRQQSCDSMLIEGKVELIFPMDDPESANVQDQYLNFTAVFRARRRDSKSGCNLAICITVSIMAIMTLGSISSAVHSRKGSPGVDRLSNSGFSHVFDTSLDLGERSGSSILRHYRPQLRIFKTSVRGRNKTRYVLPVGLSSSSSRVAGGVEFESDEAKSVGNSNLVTI